MPPKRKRDTPSVTVDMQIWEEFKIACDVLDMKPSRMLDRLMMLAIVSTNVEGLTPEQAQQAQENLQKEPHKGTALAAIKAAPLDMVMFLNHIEKVFLCSNEELLNHLPKRLTKDAPTTTPDK